MCLHLCVDFQLVLTKLHHIANVVRDSQASTISVPIMRLLTILVAVAATFAHAAQLQNNNAGSFTRQGHIVVLNASSVVNVSPSAQRVGCMNAAGSLTQTDCAVFTRTDTAPYILSTSQGNCSFLDQNMPANTDSAYGKNYHAFHCWPGAPNQLIDQVYTLVSVDRMLLMSQVVWSAKD